MGEQDRELWNLITEMPKVNLILAWISLALNIFFPGSGSAVVGCVGSNSRMNKSLIVVGFVQFCVSYAFVGWVWSVYWGYLIVKKAMSRPAGTEDVSNNQILKRGSMANQDGEAIRNVNVNHMNPYEVNE
jgi:hypothetical protein